MMLWHHNLDSYLVMRSKDSFANQTLFCGLEKVSLAFYEHPVTNRHTIVKFNIFDTNPRIYLPSTNLVLKR